MAETQERRNAITGLARVAAGASRVVRGIAMVAAVAAVIVALFLFRDGAPDAEGWIVALFLLALAAWPAVVLFVLSAALRALAALPERLRTLPADAAGRAEELRRLADRMRTVRGAGLARLPLLVWGFGRVARGSRELLGPHAGALPLVSLPFLGLSAAAIAATPVLVAVAFVLLILLAAS